MCHFECKGKIKKSYSLDDPRIYRKMDFYYEYMRVIQ